MTKEEKRALKEWLTSILPDGLSRNDVADELGVTRRTISSMLNPDAEAFPGLTMLRYLQLAGAVTEAPAESPASSRLGSLEAQVSAQGAGWHIRDILPVRADAVGGRGAGRDLGCEG